MQGLRKENAAEKTAAFKVAFDTFRKEAIKRKGEVKRGEARLNDFAAWLVMQQDEADRLMTEVWKTGLVGKMARG